MLSTSLFVYSADQGIYANNIVGNGQINYENNKHMVKCKMCPE